MSKPFSTFLSILFASVTLADAGPTLTTCAALNEALRHPASLDRQFDLTATLVYAYRHPHGTIFVRDATGATGVRDLGNNNLKAVSEGRTVRLQGHIRPDSNPRRPFPQLNPVCGILTSLQQDGAISSVSAMIGKLHDLDDNGSLIRLSGILRDAFKDEIDPNFTLLTLNCDGEDVYANFSSVEDPDFRIKFLLGETITLVGYARNACESERERQIGYSLSTHVDWIKSLNARRTDPFSVPDVPDLLRMSFRQIQTLGRRKVRGFVIARWEGANIMIRTEDGRYLSASLDGSDEVPAYGAPVVVSGIPETDSYRINLMHARCRPTDGGTAFVSRPPQVRTFSSILTDECGRRRFNVQLHGQAITLQGRLILPAAEAGAMRRAYLEQEGEIVSLDCSAIPGFLSGVPNGSVIRITGICVTQLRASLSLPRVDGFLIVPRVREDLQVISLPPWWTPGRVLVMLCVIVAALGGVLVWTVTLRRLAEHRGAELANEKLCAVESELKVYERTRLASELHDMLSQMLSGISMQIGTVRKFFDSNREKTLHHLDIAEKTLLACRESLRDCLWDLRNSTLEEPDMTKAIRGTLSPHVGNESLVIRFNVPRELLSDNAAHAILGIIRELVVNAIRHGQATTLKIAGCLENGRVLFSVADNGLGFDPRTAPGMSQGHFGLQGICERVEGFDGSMSVVSTVGTGTKVSISLKLPQAQREGGSNV